MNEKTKLTDLLTWLFVSNHLTRQHKTMLKQHNGLVFSFKTHGCEPTIEHRCIKR